MSKMTVMRSMELTDEQKFDVEMPIAMPHKPDYPYGLRGCLTDKEFEKLDLDPRALVVGGVIHMHSMARITSISTEDGSGGKMCRVEYQIEDLCIESEDIENEEAEVAIKKKSPLHDNSRS